MGSKRPIILMAILLVLVAGYVTQPYWSYLTRKTEVAAPLPGRNEVVKLALRQDANGQWVALFSYFYTGLPEYAYVSVQLVRNVAGQDALLGGKIGFRLAERGLHQVEVPLVRPYTDSPLSTSAVQAQLAIGGKTILTKQVAQQIDWPDYSVWIRDKQLAEKSATQLLNQATSLIDRGGSDGLKEAQFLLEQALVKESKLSMAYVEMARVAMKVNWGPEGLHQAESLLSSALQIEPTSVNAKILMGYVYAHQARYKQAEALFSEVATSKPANMWLWTNWGELLAMQGKSALAIEKYRVAIQSPPSHDTYDRARLQAFDYLLSLLARTNDLDAMEALHKQRIQEFGAEGCHRVAYGRFALQQRKDPDLAIRLAQESLKSQCDEVRDVLGMAYYTKWSTAEQSSGTDLLNQARIYLPAGPRPIYLLATSDSSLNALRKLVSIGEAIDQRDNNQFTALAYAVQNSDAASVKRLIRLGANPVAKVGVREIPVALLPVMSHDVDTLRVLRQSGVDYTKLRYQGQTAIEHAKQIGDRVLLEALEPKSSI